MKKLLRRVLALALCLTLFGGAAMAETLSLPEDSSTFSPELAASLCARCRGKDGARNLRRLVQTEVEGALSGFLLSCSRRPSRIKGSLEQGRLLFQV